MRTGEINAVLNATENIQLKMDEAGGATLAVELRIRLLAQLSQPIQATLKNKNKYWKCDLQYLIEAIISVCKNKLEIGEAEKLNKFLVLRHKLVHGNFVSFTKLQGIEPKGRQIIFSSTRKTLLESDIRESICSVDWNHAFSEFRKLASEVKSIVDRLIRCLADN